MATPEIPQTLLKEGLSRLQEFAQRFTPKKIPAKIKHVPRSPLDPGVRFQTEVRYYERRGGR